MARIYRMGPCGGAGGNSMDTDAGGVTRVVMVQIRSGAAIDSLSFLLERNGLEVWAPRWGGDGGSTFEIRLGVNEYLTCLRGHVGQFDGAFVLRSLTIDTNMRTVGPFGVQEGMPYELPAAGGRIVGFHGRSGSLLDALGVFVRQDMPSI